ncbi:unnamed protein product [Rotaria socialis]|uniref:Uncharacterized protein n=1 Tax=Rotaria socialis TaxID=392032 RepID=A0A819UVF0_9BILA|nr:unnamed protein product [Rotaria socialis]CAF4101492.1 unnamed protein product [Rotaria socialis]CAF4337904.1 unnamed protein product [Rotaria socialis]
MNFKLYLIWFGTLMLCLLPFAISINEIPQDRKCHAQCMEYCTNESESGIPLHLCDNACLTMCYSARRDVGEQKE